MNKRISREFGFIDYIYVKNKKYPNGLIIGNGAYVNKEFRCQGKLKKLLAILFELYPDETILQYAIKNKKLISMFKRLNFKKVTSIEYWGNPSNTVVMQGKIYPNIIEDLKNIK